MPSYGRRPGTPVEPAETVVSIAFLDCLPPREALAATAPDMRAHLPTPSPDADEEDDDDEEDDRGSGGGNIDPDEDEGSVDEDDEDDEEPLWTAPRTRNRRTAGTDRRDVERG